MKTKIALEKIPVCSLASGDTLSVSCYTVTGTDKNAPTAYLQSAVHGAEVQGSIVIALLLEHFEKNPPLGTVRLVPNANPMGLNEKQGEYTQGRFDTALGMNFNRAYYLPTKDFDWDSFLKKNKNPSKEVFRAELKKRILAKDKNSVSLPERLCLELQKRSIDFDHVLDLHCANKSVRYAYVPQYAKESAQYLSNSLFQILIPNSFGGAMDEVSFVPWWTLAEKTGSKTPFVEAFTLECGPQEEISSSGAEEDMRGILNYLAHRGIVSGKATKAKVQQCLQKNYHTLYAPVGGLVEFKATLGKRLKKGEEIARILQVNDGIRWTELKAPADVIPILFHSSSIVHEGAELSKLFYL